MPVSKPRTETRTEAHDDTPAFDIPADKVALHQWIHANLGIALARRPMDLDHQAPFDYILHTFFGDRPDRGAASDRGTAFPGGAQRAEARCHAPDAVLWANRGGGKTFLGAIATALDLIFKPGIEVRILAGSLEQAERMHHHLRAFFTRDNLEPFVDGRITDTRLRLKNKSRVELLAQSQTSVRGTRVQKLRCDELNVFDPLVWEAAQLTTRSARCGDWLVRGSIECLSTMHLPHGPMARVIAEARAGKRRLFRWNVLDVLETCPPARPCDTCSLHAECRARAKEHEGGHIAIDDAVTQKSRVALLTWESEMLCLRPKRTDCVFPEFDHRRHIFEGDIETAGAVFLCGMDFGYRTAAVLWAALLPDGTLHIVDERIVQNATLGTHIAAILDPMRPRPLWLAVDPAGLQVNDQTGRSAVQLLSAAGLEYRARVSKVAPGLLAVRARLQPADGSPPRLLIHARCKRLIEALDAYHYDPARPDLDTPVKDGIHDHPIDALRYLVINLDQPRTLRQHNYIAP